MQNIIKPVAYSKRERFMPIAISENLQTLKNCLVWELISKLNMEKTLAKMLLTTLKNKHNWYFQQSNLFGRIQFSERNRIKIVSSSGKMKISPVWLHSDSHKIQLQKSRTNMTKWT